MVRVTTVALLERRPEISRSLFSRYWRDVHGVIDATYVMVEAGRPTQLGLRGLDALKTIDEASAVNQLDDAVAAAIYGSFGPSRQSEPAPPRS